MSRDSLRSQRTQRATATRKHLRGYGIKNEELEVKRKSLKEKTEEKKPQESPAKTIQKARKGAGPKRKPQRKIRLYNKSSNFAT